MQNTNTIEYYLQTLHNGDSIMPILEQVQRLHIKLAIILSNQTLKPEVVQRMTDDCNLEVKILTFNQDGAKAKIREYLLYMDQQLDIIHTAQTSNLEHLDSTPPNKRLHMER